MMTKTAAAVEAAAVVVVTSDQATEQSWEPVQLFVAVVVVIEDRLVVCSLLWLV
jgi:hypothetical protein